MWKKHSIQGCDLTPANDPVHPLDHKSMLFLEKGFLVGNFCSIKDQQVLYELSVFGN